MENHENKLLNLTELIGSGNERDCFIHPDNPKYCVKVTKPGVVGRRQNEIDMAYFEVLKRRNISSPHIPACHGWVETNRGKGIVVERICRPDLSPLRDRAPPRPLTLHRLPLR